MGTKENNPRKKIMNYIVYYFYIEFYSCSFQQICSYIYIIYIEWECAHLRIVYLLTRTITYTICNVYNFVYCILKITITITHFTQQSFIVYEKKMWYIIFFINYYCRKFYLYNININYCFIWFYYIISFIYTFFFNNCNTDFISITFRMNKQQQ